MSQCPFCNKATIKNEFFYETKQTLALYNLKPVIKGHCLVIPRRHKERFADLSSIERNELLQSVNKVCILLQQVHHARAFSILIQDGLAAGQTVPHLHVHVTPMDGTIKTRTLISKAAQSKQRKKISALQMQKEVNLLRKAAKQFL